MKITAVETLHIAEFPNLLWVTVEADGAVEHPTWSADGRWLASTLSSTQIWPAVRCSIFTAWIATRSAAATPSLPKAG